MKYYSKYNILSPVALWHWKYCTMYCVKASQGLELLAKYGILGTFYDPFYLVPIWDDLWRSFVELDKILLDLENLSTFSCLSLSGRIYTPRLKLWAAWHRAHYYKSPSLSIMFLCIKMGRIYFTACKQDYIRQGWDSHFKQSIYVCWFKAMQPHDIRKNMPLFHHYTINYVKASPGRTIQAKYDNLSLIFWTIKFSTYSHKLYWKLDKVLYSNAKNITISHVNAY